MKPQITDKHRIFNSYLIWSDLKSRVYPCPSVVSYLCLIYRLGGAKEPK